MTFLCYRWKDCPLTKLSSIVRLSFRLQTVYVLTPKQRLSFDRWSYRWVSNKRCRLHDSNAGLVIKARNIINLLYRDSIFPCLSRSTIWTTRRFNNGLRDSMIYQYIPRFPTKKAEKLEAWTNELQSTKMFAIYAFINYQRQKSYGRSNVDFFSVCIKWKIFF